MQPRFGRCDHPCPRQQAALRVLHPPRSAPSACWRWRWPSSSPRPRPRRPSRLRRPRARGVGGWAPTGRPVLGRPVLFTGSANGAFVAWMDPQLTKPVVVPGTGDPLGSPWGGQVAPDQRPFLVSAFNGGFKFGDFDGAVMAFGASYRSPVAGQGSLIVYDDGSYTVGRGDVTTIRTSASPRSVRTSGCSSTGERPLRQPRTPAHGAGRSPVSRRRAAWSASTRKAPRVGRRSVEPARPRNALIAAGAVRGMQMDINPDWVNFNSYDVGADNVAHGNGIFGATGPDRYLRPDGRDFVAVLVRGTVVPGATAKLGADPLAATGEGEVADPGIRRISRVTPMRFPLPCRSRSRRARARTSRCSRSRPMRGT